MIERFGCAFALLFAALFWAVVVVAALLIGSWLGFIKVSGLG